MMDDPMAEIRASFFIECEELLEALQDGLQILDNGEGDGETINIVFRAVHSIKGGAGAFGLEALVRFAHRYETVLDEVRSDRLQVDQEALKVFFQAADHLSDLVRISRDDEELPVAMTAQLLTLLDGLLGDLAPAADDTTEDEIIEFNPTGLLLDIDLDSDGPEEASGFDLEDLPPPAPMEVAEPGPIKQYQIHFAPHAELFDTGNEPAFLLRTLQELGETRIMCNASDIPPLAKINPVIPHLSWQIDLECVADAHEIMSVFEFVDGLCELEIEHDEADLPANSDGIAIEIQTQDTAAPPSKLEQHVEDLEAPAFQARPNADQPEPAMQKKPVASQPILPEKSAKPPSSATTKTVVRVDLDRIERLVNLVGELVINQAMLSQSLEQSGMSPHSDAMSGLEEFQRLTRDIQDSVMMIRAQPVKSLFQRMSRIVREASAAVSKDVRLNTFGEGTEVDKTVIERLADPLTHMIRNAVDHGLETPEARIAAGKPPQGQVNLTAAHRSGRVVIEIADDGAGINRSKVRQIAIDKGLISAEAVLSDTEIDNLLFLPGFSTASVVSDLSGRGVGMDVVRTAIQALSGRITITSEPGEGSTFSISLPLTLAVLDGMVVEVAGETLVLPLNLVVETLTVEEGQVQMVRPGDNVIKVRSGFVPLFDLGHALGYRGPIEDHAGSVVLLIAQEDESRTALVIDNIVDQRQVVIKGLDDSLYRAPGIAAATILGDGQIALILDPSDIVDSTHHLVSRAPPSMQECITP